jgi:hypothetical protein
MYKVQSAAQNAAVFFASFVNARSQKTFIYPQFFVGFCFALWDEVE